mgnify:CR=1 FL=1
MTDQEQREQDFKLIAELLYGELEPYRPTHARNWADSITQELLDLREPCFSCSGTGRFLLKGCSECNGTGKGEKVLLRRADNQTLPTVCFVGYGSENTEKIRQARKTQQDMIAGDKDTHWVKVWR